MPWQFFDRYGTLRQSTSAFPVIQPIFDTVLSSTSATIDIQNIPQTFSHLRLVVSARHDSAAGIATMLMRFNNDTTAGDYLVDYITSITGGAPSGSQTAANSGLFIGTVPGSAQGANLGMVTTVEIPDYTNTALVKSMTASAYERSQGRVDLIGGSWQTTAINRITLALSAGNFIAGSRVTLYGIGVVPVPSPGSMLPVTYGTSLPASPVDGQEAILVDSTSNPSYKWRMRYNGSSSSAYKWEFTGGDWAVLSNTTTDTGVNGGYALLTNSPLFTTPRAGDWAWDISVLWNHTDASGTTQTTGVGYAAALTPTTNGSVSDNRSGYNINLSTFGTSLAVPASSNLGIVTSGNGSDWQTTMKVLRVRPKRLA